MNDFSRADLDTLKAQVDLAELMRSSGIDLKAEGQNLKACCPWHEDKTPSLVFNPMIPCMITGSAFVMFMAYRWGMQERARIGIIAFSGEASYSADSGDPEVEALKRPGKFWINFALVVVLMTCLMMGVLPLAISTGAGANSRHAIGTGVIGGMIGATALGILLVPVFYVVVRRLLGDKSDGTEDTDAGNGETIRPFD